MRARTLIAVAMLVAAGCTSDARTRTTTTATATTIAAMATTIAANTTTTAAVAPTSSAASTTLAPAPGVLPTGPDLVDAAIVATTASGRQATAEFFLRGPVLAADGQAPSDFVDCPPRLLARTSTAAFVPFDVVILADAGEPLPMSLQLADGFTVRVLIESPVGSRTATCSDGAQHGITVEAFGATATMSGWFMVPDVVSPNAPAGAMTRLVDHTVAVSLDLGDGARDEITGPYGVPVDFFAGSRQALRIYVP